MRNLFTYALAAIAAVGVTAGVANAPFSAPEATSTSHDYDWENANNVAKGTTAYASYNQELAGASVDGNNGSRWEPNAGQDPENVWYYVDLGYQYDIKAIGLIWNNAYASDYTLFTATEKAGDEPAWEELVNIKEMLGSYDEIEIKDGEGNVTETRTEWVNHAEGVTSTYVLSEQKKARYVKIQVNKNEVWGASFYEFMVDAEGADITPVATSITLRTNTQKALVGDVVNFTTEVRDQLNRVMENPDVTLQTSGADAHVEGMNVIPDAKGTVSVTATCGAITSEAASFEVVGDAAEYISGTGISCDENSNNPSNAYDNNNGTEWTVSGEGEGENEHWFMVELAGLYDLNLVTLNWEGANANIIEIQAGETAENLAKIGEVNVPAVVAGRLDYVVVDAKNVKYLKVITKNNATGYGLRLFDCRAYGTPAAYEQIATSIELASDKYGLWIGETALLTATVKDQEGATIADANANITVEGPATLSGNTLTATGKGTIIVKAEYNGLNAEMTLGAADKSMGITPVSAWSDAKNTDGNDCAANAIDDNYSGSGWAAARDGYATEGATEYNLYINLGKPYSIDAITLNWEGANAHQYQILGSKTEDGEYTPFYTYYEETNPVRGREDVFMGAEMSEIQYIQVKATAWGPYGINLFGIKFFGESSVKSIPTSIDVTCTMGSALYVDETAEFTAVVKDQFGDTMNNVEVEYTVTDGTSVSIEGNRITANSTGASTVKATCGDAEQYFHFIVYPDMTANFISNENMNAIHVDAEGNETVATGVLTPENDVMVGEGEKVIIDLGAPAKVALITLNWETACASDYTVKVAATREALETAEAILTVEGRATGEVTDRIALNAAEPAEPAAIIAFKSATLDQQFVEVAVNGVANKDWNNGKARLFQVASYAVSRKDPGTSTCINNILGNTLNDAVEIYDLDGRMIMKAGNASDAINALPAGIYIIGGKKTIVK